MKSFWMTTLAVGLSIGVVARLIDEGLQRRVLAQRGALGSDPKLLQKAVERLPWWQRHLLLLGLGLAPRLTVAALQRAMREAKAHEQDADSPAP